MKTVVEDWRAVPIGDTALPAYYAEVASLQKTRAASSERRAKIWAWLFGAAMTANVALATSVAGLVPLQRLVPELLYVRADGTVDSAETVSSLPATQADAVIRAALWRYVEEREGYTWADARERYETVSLMSAPDVRQAYQQWFVRDKKTSPQYTPGRKGQVDLYLIAMTELRPGVGLVRFRAVTSIDGEITATVTRTATIQYTMAAGMTAQARLVDPGGILITRYQSTEDTPN